MPKCTQCGSVRAYKDGWRDLAIGKAVQRWLCRECGYRFSVGQVQNNPNKNVKQTINHQVCVLKEAKNLTATESKTVAGDRKTSIDHQALKGKLLEFEFWLNKQGYDEVGSKNRAYLMKRMANLGAKLSEPETIKEVLAKQKTWNDGYKMLIVYAYESYLKMQGLSWERPKYKQPDAYPFIPTEAELDQLISAPPLMWIWKLLKFRKLWIILKNVVFDENRNPSAISSLMN